MIETGKIAQQSLMQWRWFLGLSVRSFWSVLGKKWVHRPFAGRPYLKWVWAKNPYIHLSFSISISKCSHYRTPFAAALCWQNSPLLTWSWRKATGLFAWINSRLQPELELWLQKCCIAGLIYLLQNTGHKRTGKWKFCSISHAHIHLCGLCRSLMKVAWKRLNRSNAAQRHTQSSTPTHTNQTDINKDDLVYYLGKSIIIK